MSESQTVKTKLSAEVLAWQEVEFDVELEPYEGETGRIWLVAKAKPPKGIRTEFVADSPDLIAAIEEGATEETIDAAGEAAVRGIFPEAGEGSGFDLADVWSAAIHLGKIENTTAEYQVLKRLPAKGARELLAAAKRSAS